MKEYVLNLTLDNWENQLWFSNEDTTKIKQLWQEAIKQVEKLKENVNDPIIFQNKVIEYFESIGFKRIQK